MPDVRGMFERAYIGSWDLQGRDVTVKIARVVAATLTAQGGRQSKKPVVYFEGTEKGFVLNKTTSKTIAAMYGFDTDAWTGQRITLYATTTTMGSETVDAIRVRPTVPKGKARALESQPVDRVMREKQDRAAAEVLADMGAKVNGAAEETEEEDNHGT